MSWTKEQTREYNRERHRTRRAKYIEMLGGSCARCGSTEQLEFDHVEPTEKRYTISAYFKGKEERHEAELKKCQLLCKQCHIEKSIEDSGKNPARGVHGTLSSYNHCRCTECRAAKSAYNRMHDKRERKRAPLQHGMMRMYRRGCRCPECRAANAAKMRAYKQKVLAR